ncbi:MAG: hypothetical protein M3071_16700 [Actinomycetota bacterium]|nr:hypothetical protein [Actinomycetota bacterium]
MATSRLIRRETLLTALVLSLVVATSAQATRKPTRRELRAIAAAALPTQGPYAHAGRVGWAEISTAGPYAATYLVARPDKVKVFQDVLFLLRRRGRHWHVIADILHERCPGVPGAVLLDLQHFFMSQKPGFISPAATFGCAARIAHAH